MADIQNEVLNILFNMEREAENMKYSDIRQERLSTLREAIRKVENIEAADVQPVSVIKELQEQIASVKRSVKSENSDYLTGYIAALSAVEGMIDDIQPVKRGRWFHINDEGIVYCSECNNEAYWDTDYGQQLFDFCPYCGAEMVSREAMKKVF